jgi:hypothetical protein
MSITGIPTRCKQCGAELDPHNITGLCHECKLIARNARLSGRPADYGEPVTKHEAIDNIFDILGVHVRVTPAFYDQPCVCGKALARADNGLCEWCTATFVMLANDP